jgi:hypothetical protein
MLSTLLTFLSRPALQMWGTTPNRATRQSVMPAPQCSETTRPVPLNQTSLSHIFGSKQGGVALGAFIAASQACLRPQRKELPPEDHG